MRKAIAVGGALALGAMIVALIGRGRAKPEDATPHPGAWAHGVGYVEPLGEVRRLAFKHGGVIARAPVEIGGCVVAGTVLMTLRDEAERAALAEAEAAVALAQAELAQLRAGINSLQIQAVRAAKTAAEAGAAHARQEFARQKALLETRAASRAEFDHAEAELRRAEAVLWQRTSELSHLENHVRDTDLAVAEARVRAAEAKAAGARARCAETELRAPCDGVVLERLRRGGEATAGGEGEPVLIFADPARLCVRAEIDETQALALRAGQGAVVGGHALAGREFTGRVTLVKNLMGRKTVFAHSATERRDLDVLQVLIELPPGVTLPIGLEVDVRVRVDARD